MYQEIFEGQAGDEQLEWVMENYFAGINHS